MAKSSLQEATTFLESYSNAVSTIAAEVSPAIIRVQSHRRGRKHWGPGRNRGGHGSGVVIDAKEGHVLTNFHVTRNSDKVKLRKGDGVEVEGEVLGVDPVSDLAVVKTEADGLSAAELGDSDALKVGEAVIALGSPSGERAVVTAGVVSALEVELRGPSGRLMTGLIQTDALFNPGMSGGALVDASGKVVGINTASIMESQGINLAIAINTAQKITESLIAGGIERPRLGVGGERVRIYGGLVRHHKLEVTHGITVRGVEEDSGAEAAGISKGDIVIGIDDHLVQGVDDLQRVLEDYKVDDEVTINVIRDLELLKLKMKLGSDK